MGEGGAGRPAGEASRAPRADSRPGRKSLWAGSGPSSGGRLTRAASGPSPRISSSVRPSDVPALRAAPASSRGGSSGWPGAAAAGGDTRAASPAAASPANSPTSPTGVADPRSPAGSSERSEARSRSGERQRPRAERARRGGESERDVHWLRLDGLRRRRRRLREDRRARRREPRGARPSSRSSPNREPGREPSQTPMSRPAYWASEPWKSGRPAAWR